jgi:hypothetical protein
MELASGRSGTVQAPHIVQLQVNGVESSHPINPNIAPANIENSKKKKRGGWLLIPTWEIYRERGSVTDAFNVPPPPIPLATK